MSFMKENIVDIELTSGNIHRSFLNHSIGRNDDDADWFGVRVFRNGEPVNLEGSSVQGFFKQPGRDPIAITSGNNISGNLAEVLLPQACYNYEGQFTLAIKLVSTSEGVTGTMRIVDGMVDNTNVNGAVAPTGAIPTYQEILAVYEQMVAAKEGSVRFDITQQLTSAQQLRARNNISGASQADMDTVNGKIGNTTLPTTAQTLTGAIAEEVAEREAAVSAEASAREAAVAAETAAREAGGAEIKSALNGKADDIGSYNRFDKTNVEAGTISKAGVITPASSWNVSDYIPVNPGMVLYAFGNSASAYALYDLNKEVISNSTNWSNPFTVPSNVYYIRISVNDSNLNSAYLSTVDSYDDYKTIMAYVRDRFAEDEESTTLLGGRVTSLETNATEANSKISNNQKAISESAPLFTENLIANTTITAGYSINAGTGALTPVTGWNVTDYISLRSGIPYSNINLGNSGFAFFDANKAFVDLRSNPNVCSNNKLLTTFVLPEGIMYGRFTSNDSSIGLAMLSSYALYDLGETVDGKLVKNEKAAFAGVNALKAMQYKNGQATLSENMYRHGSFNADASYSIYNYNRRIISKYFEWYPFDLIFTPSNGARLICLKIVNGSYVVSSWTTDPLTIPAETRFILMVEATENASVSETCAMVTGMGITDEPSQELPNYYYTDNYIGNEIDTIIDKSPLDGLQFAFLTDVHVRQNAGNSPALIKYIRDNTNAVPFVAFGGDVNVSTVDEGVDVREDARIWQSWMNKIGKAHVYQAQGNHDYLGYHYVNSERILFNETLGVCRQLVIGNLEDAHIVGVPGKLWYYVEIPTAKTRIVFLNDYDTTRNDGVFYGYNGMSVDQIQWVVDKALDTDGIRVIFVSHQTYDEEMEGENQQVFVGMQRLFTAIANKTAYSYGAIQKDFTNSTIEFVAHLCGHMHDDASNVNDGVLTIQTTCDGIMNNNEGRTAGTITEQAFDIVTVDYTNGKLYMTRIGYGNDREFDLT